MSFQIKPPHQFNIDEPENWTAWTRRFEHYRLASKLHQESEKDQVLLYLLNDHADSIFSSFRLTEDHSNILIYMLQQSKSFKTSLMFGIKSFMKEQNSTCENKNWVDESVDAFKTSLHSLVDT